MFTRVHQTLRRLAADQRGFSLVFTGLAAAVLMGAVGLAVDVGAWEMNQRNMQAAADEAAYSADIAAQAGQNYTTQADAVAAQLGFVNGQNGVSVAVHNPPSQGSNTSNTSAYEVIITQPQTMWFANYFLSTAPTASARAVSAAATGGACVLALDTNNENHSILVKTAGAVVTINGCIVADNTINGNPPNTTDALDVKAGGTLNVQNVYLATSSICDGGSCAGTLNVSGTIKYNQPPLTDPYASRTVPTPGSCSYTNLVVASSQTLSPGTYCSTTNNAALTVTASLTGTATANANKNTSVITMSSTSGIAVGMYVTDTQTTNALASSTKITAVTATTITVSPVIANNLKNNDTLAFSIAPFLTESANANKNTTVLTFASTTGVSAGMQVAESDNVEQHQFGNDGDGGHWHDRDRELGARRYCQSQRRRAVLHPADRDPEFRRLHPRRTGRLLLYGDHESSGLLERRPPGAGWRDRDRQRGIGRPHHQHQRH